MRALLDALAEWLGYVPRSRLDLAEQRALCYHEDYRSALESLERAVWRSSNADTLSQEIKFLREEIERRQFQERHDSLVKSVARARERLEIAKNIDKQT